jgi:glycosyltransferase involved in cell wall biosynthesis/peptidoglycan/xylan/chitin deacetylase (PgdA/CDA1 family)
MLGSTLASYGQALPFVDTATRRILGAGSIVFMFHRVLPQGEECYEAEMVCAKEAFEHFLDWLGQEYRVLPLEFVAARRADTIDSKKPACAITFDDGWVDNFFHAFPLLRDRGFPATIFLPVCFIGTLRRFWQERLWSCLNELRNDDLRSTSLRQCSRVFPWFRPDEALFGSYGALKRFLMTRPSEEAEEFVQSLEECANLNAASGRSFLSWNEVKAMQQEGVTYGSHTLHHTLLTNAAPRSVKKEIGQSRDELSERLGTPVVSFSYPWGSANSVSRDHVEKAGYSFAVTAASGVVNALSDPCLLPRIAVSSSILRDLSHDFNAKKARLSFAKGVLTSGLLPSKTAKNGAPQSQRVRIIFVIDLIDGWQAGTESQLRRLIQMLDGKHFDPQLVCFFPFSGVPLESFPCRVHFLCEEKSPPSIPVRLLRLTRLLRKLKPHVVQTHFTEGNTLGVFAAWLAHIPVIVGTTRNTAPYEKAGERWMGTLARKLANYWQCNSRAAWTFEQRERKTPSEKIEILPNALDLARCAPFEADQRDKWRIQLGLDTRGPIVVSVANLRPVKDLGTLVKAARFVRDQFPNVCFLLLGEGPDYDKLSQQIDASGLTGAVRLVGGCADVIPYIASADIGVLTSRSEGSSNAVLEYMAVGLPPVVSDIPPNRELLEGVFFTPGDAQDLAEKLVSLLQNRSLAKKLAERHRQFILQFDTEHFLRRAEGFYSRLTSLRS